MNDNDVAPKYGRLGAGFQPCNDASVEICHHIEHVNRNQMMSWMRCRQSQIEDAEIMKRRIEHGFYDDNADAIGAEAQRVIDGHEITDYELAMHTVEHLYSIFSETREGYGLMTAIASDMYDYRIRHDMTDSLSLARKGDGGFEDGFARLLSTAREASAWFHIDIGAVIEDIARNPSSSRFTQRRWNASSPPESYNAIDVDMDAFGIIHGIHITDSMLVSSSYDVIRLQYDADVRDEIMGIIVGKPLLLRNRSTTLTALCLQFDGFLPKMKAGVIQPVEISRFMPSASIQKRSSTPSADMMIAMKLASLDEAA